MRQRRAFWLAIVLAATTTMVVKAAPLEATPLCGVVKGPKGHAPVIGPESRKPLKVVSLNLLHGLTPEGDQTLDKRQDIAIAQLAAADVDVVATQEVTDSANHGAVYSEIAEGLAKTTGYWWFWCFFRAFPHFPGEPETRDGGGGPISDLAAQQSNPQESRWYEGGAIYSKHTIVRAEAYRLPGEDQSRLTTECVATLPDPNCILETEFESRIAIWARIFTNSGLIDVTSAHTSGTKAQHDALVSWLSTQSSEVADQVLACDCNALEGSDAMASIKAGGWTDTYRALHTDPGYTADQQIAGTKRTVTERIDYVWVKSKIYKLLSSRIVLNTKKNGFYPSDHYGVLAELKVSWL